MRNAPYKVDRASNAQDTEFLRELIAAKVQLFAGEELSWQTPDLPKMANAGIIDRCVSAWSAGTNFVRKGLGDDKRLQIDDLPDDIQYGLCA
ncbi:hypothetical protein N7466_003155 [Penicillium verhagenii]|uniref:uncharacterized protein n=1 Tax=Penicillium verhagenii TaxID=1562060 RepID=UPI0025459A68|nr:uncharacterized protein N7466_003155 [Penicillium verhagenii]KAJ5936705.1 hypothetical protein N7466_003155 [Penicillium verhagenii]